MQETVSDQKARSFTVELRSRSALKNASLNAERNESVLLEGTLGALKAASFLDGVVLEIVGTEGILRVDLLLEEILESHRGRTRRSARQNRRSLPEPGGSMRGR